MTRDEAHAFLTEMTKSESILRHGRTMELVMRAMARHFGADEEQFGICGFIPGRYKRPGIGKIYG